MHTLDTNVIIYFLKGDESVRRVFIDEVAITPVFVSVITETELFSYPHLTAADAGALDVFLAKTIIIPVDSRIARLAAQVKRENRISLGDSIIAATAFATGTTLLTRNINDFRKVTGLSVQEV